MEGLCTTGRWIGATNVSQNLCDVPHIDLERFAPTELPLSPHKESARISKASPHGPPPMYPISKPQGETLLDVASSYVAVFECTVQMILESLFALAVRFMVYVLSGSFIASLPASRSSPLVFLGVCCL